MISTQINRARIMILLALMTMGFFVACQTTPDPDPTPSPSSTKIAYATIKSSAVAYEAVMKALGDLDRQGKLTDAQKSTVISYGEKFWTAYHTAVDALIAFKAGGSELNLETSLSTLTAALSGFLEYSAEITK